MNWLQELAKLSVRFFSEFSIVPIKASVDHPYESASAGFEGPGACRAHLKAALRSYAAAVVAGGDWPQHLAAWTPAAATPLADLQAALSSYFSWAKGGGDAGDLLASCQTADDMPEYVRTTLAAIKKRH
ncbi:hypothetical protein [Pseudomonas aeruginosa]|uniref:hypothetical protein n=1 Tax=Pseudomonas aeruginosa TaxID=287 RepID=UPI00287F8726|nr:hypothetical protein [Pseudomonas aeruginosa]